MGLFGDKSFDMVLNLDPMYHLFNKKDKNKAISETLRVVKKGGICVFAYLSCASLMSGYGLPHQGAERLGEVMDNRGNG